MSLVATIGTLGNALVIAAIASYKTLRNVHNVFVANLVFADLLVTTITTPLSVVGAVDKGAFLRKHDALCRANGHLVILSCGASIISIAFIAIERYMFLCHQNMHAKIYKRVTIPLMVIFIWLTAVAGDSLNWDIIGWSKHGFRAETLTCNFSYEDANIKYIWSTFAYIGSGYPIIFVCYLRIYLLVRRQSFKGSSSIKAADKRLLKIFATIFVVLTVMWAPFSVTYVLNFYMPVLVPDWMHYVSSRLVLTNSSANFMIYAFSKDFRDGYKIVCKAVTGWKYFKVNMVNKVAAENNVD